MLEINRLVAPPLSFIPPMHDGEIDYSLTCIPDASILQTEEISTAALRIGISCTASRLLPQNSSKISSTPHHHPSIKIFSKKADSLQEQQASAKKKWLAKLVSEAYTLAH